MIVLIRPPHLLSITWKIYQVKKPDSDLHSWQAGEIIVTLHWTFSRTSSGHSNAAAGILTHENIIPSNTLAPCSRQNDLLLIQTHSVFLARGSSLTRSVIPRIKSNVTAARIQEICMNLAFKQLTSSWWKTKCYVWVMKCAALSFFKWTSSLYASPKSSEHLWPGQHTVVGLQPRGAQIHLQ